MKCEARTGDVILNDFLEFFVVGDVFGNVFEGYFLSTTTSPGEDEGVVKVCHIFPVVVEDHDAVSCWSVFTVKKFNL